FDGTLSTAEHRPCRDRDTADPWPDRSYRVVMESMASGGYTGAATQTAAYAADFNASVCAFSAVAAAERLVASAFGGAAYGAVVAARQLATIPCADPAWPVACRSPRCLAGARQ